MIRQIEVMVDIFGNKHRQRTEKEINKTGTQFIV